MTREAAIDHETLEKAVRRVWSRARECQVCTSTMSWGIVRDLVELRGYYEGIRMEGGPSWPMVAVMCEHCGHTVLINAVRLGLIDPDTGKVKR
jgi:hypothetical protein